MGTGEILLGLLMARGPDPGRPFGALTRFAETVSSLAGPLGAGMVAFAPADADPAGRRVAALRYLGPRLGWAAEETRLPDVLWNRYFGRDEGPLLEGLQRCGVSLLNEGTLNKWEAYRWLAGDRKVAGLLPETVQPGSAFSVLEMLQRHLSVYLKPVAGAVGRGIIRVRRPEDGLLRLEYMSSQTGGLRTAYATAAQLDRWLARWAGRYIAQQGLDLEVFHGRPADVRVLVQKDGAGRWQVTGMGARVAAHGRFTANLHTGGRPVPVGMLAEAVCPDDIAAKNRLQARLAQQALAVALRVEEATGPLGELGLDFGVDRQGRIWYIEQNAQPGRAIFADLGRQDLSDLAHRRPVEYAVHLASTKSVRAAGHPST